MDKREIYTFLKSKSHGDSIILNIEGEEVEGKIAIECGKIFICTNHRYLNGSNASNKLGFSYSWVVSDMEDINYYIYEIKDIEMGNKICNKIPKTKSIIKSLSIKMNGGKFKTKYKLI